MEIRTIKVKDLEMNIGQIEGLPSNPRQWTNEEMDRLKRSIKETPELLEARGAIVYPQDGKFIVLGGNMRLEAVKALGWKSMPCIVLPEDMPVEKLKEIVIKDNGSFGEWDMDALANAWDDLPLSEWGANVAWEGIDNGDSGVSHETASSAEDDFSEEEDDIVQVVKAGDLWKLGNHVLMCGDSADAECVKKLMGGAMADLVFTDPPYGVAIGDKNKALNSVQKAGRCTENIKNDNISVDELYPILVKAMANCRENCKEDASYYVTSPQGGELGLMMMMMMKDAGLPVRHMLVWEKNSATFSLGRLDYDYQHEPIFYTWTKKHHNYRKGEYRTTIWKYDKPRKCDLHPTMKPVALVANCLLDGTEEGNIVLDVFGGSGTTMIACEQLGRRCRMMELDPHYCDVIIARWEKLTGRKAEKIE